MKHYTIHYLELSNGETLAYRTAGNGDKTIILLHGNLSSSVHFTETMRELSKQFTVYAIDMRGFGDSTYNKPALSLHAFAKDIECFMNQLSIKTCSLLGWSTGGGVALEIAADLPSRINKVFLVGSVGLQGYLSLLAPSIPQVPMLPVMLTYHTSRNLMRWNPALQEVEYAIKYRDRSQAKELLAHLYREHPIPADEFNCYIESLFQQRNYSDVFYNLLEFNITNEGNGINNGSNRITLIQSPIVIIHGDHDKIVPLKTAHQTNNFFGEQAALYVLDSGHSVMTDAFDPFIQILIDELS